MSHRFRVAARAAALKPDVFHVHEPELLGPVLARAGSKPVIWDVHESYLDVLVERKWIPDSLKPSVRLAWDWRESRLVRRCAAVVVVTERIATRYRRLHKKVSVVANFPDLSSFTALPTIARDGKTCAFVGGIDPQRGLDGVLSAMVLLQERGLAVPLVLAGPATSYVEGLLADAGRLGLNGLVTFKGLVSKGEAIRLQNRASIGLVPYLPIGNNMAGLPNKLLESMALGLPVVYSNFPSYEEVAGASRAGLSVDPTRSDAIADAIEYLVRNPDVAREMGENGRRAVRERFNWTVERQKLLALYEDVVGAPAPKAAAAMASR